MTSCTPSTMSWSDSPVADLLASLIAEGDAGENAVKRLHYNAHMTMVSTAIGVMILSVAVAAVILRVKPE